MVKGIFFLSGLCRSLCGAGHPCECPFFPCPILSEKGPIWGQKVGKCDMSPLMSRRYYSWRCGQTCDIGAAGAIRGGFCRAESREVVLGSLNFSNKSKTTND